MLVFHKNLHLRKTLFWNDFCANTVQFVSGVFISCKTVEVDVGVIKDDQAVQGPEPRLQGPGLPCSRLKPIRIGNRNIPVEFEVCVSVESSKALSVKR